MASMMKVMRVRMMGKRMMRMVVLPQGRLPAILADEGCQVSMAFRVMNCLCHLLLLENGLKSMHNGGIVG